MGTACHFANSIFRAFHCTQPDELGSQNIMEYWIKHRMYLILNDRCHHPSKNLKRQHMLPHIVINTLHTQ